MTSRLKRKLENIGVDVQSHSSKLTENFCLIGTPLPSLEKTKDTGEFVPVWKQEVRDEQGRRRLHGAFTGGFSAGYYNTVGSKEGWVPSTFISSRSDRASKKQARPEDFMDEEDLAELQDSKKLVDTTEETDIFGGTQAELSRRSGEGRAEDDSIASALESLLPPAKDSVGARLLKKMGWRLGQGIGPRVTYKQLRAKEGRPIGKDEPVDEEANKHMYAPRDTKVVIYHKKENAFGLGYSPGHGLSQIVQGRDGQTAGMGPNISAGFGLGALNEAEDDDVDIYDHAQRESRRMAYDVRDAEEDDHIGLHGKKHENILAAPTKMAGATFGDGRPLVSGFVLFEKPLVEDRWFPIPDIPNGWTPDPRRVWGKDISTEQDRLAGTAQASRPQDHRSWLKGKTANERGSMLGETPLPSAPRSVFDYLSQKDRDRLKNLAAGLASGSASQTQTTPPPPISVPRMEPHIAQAALKSFQPFAKGSQTQLRYTAYLQSQATPSEAGELKPLPGQSNEEFNKEVSDYAKASKVFKPISAAMAGRFESASTNEMLGSTNQGLHKPTQEDYARLDAPPVEDGEKKQEEESPQAHAARMGMFGPLTRETRLWQPARLLCKRFGVKEPSTVAPESEPGASGFDPNGQKARDWRAEVGASSGDAKPGSAFTASEAEKQDNEAAGTGTGTGTGTGVVRRDLENIGLGEDEGQGKDTLTYERPAKDIFKAIFASDDEESEEEAEAAVDTPAPKDAPVAPSSNGAAGEPGQVDLATFRPTFVPKSARMNAKDKEGKPSKRGREKKKKGKMVVSFEVEAGGGEDGAKKEKRPKVRVNEDKDEAMWVEKPPPEITRNLVIPIATEPEDDDEPQQRRRKRAVDFL